MKFVRACPNCGSNAVHEETAQFFRKGDVGEFRCNGCDFSAELFPEVATNALVDFQSSRPNAPVKASLKRLLRVRVERAAWLTSGVTLTYLYGAIGFVLVLFAVTLRRKL